ncbi:MAG TPA: hypothetical protein PKY60_02250, partial [Thermoflexales bacterium]|nr:hypothetical protein [Thermoflexales bacterium]
MSRVMLSGAKHLWLTKTWSVALAEILRARERLEWVWLNGALRMTALFWAQACHAERSEASLANKNLERS